MYSPWTQISTWTLTHAQHCDLALESCLIQNHLSLSLSPSLSHAAPRFPGVILEKNLLSCCPKISWGYPGKKSLNKDYIQSKILSVVQKEFLCRNRDIPLWAILPTLFPLSAPHSEQRPQHVNWSLLGSQIKLRDQNIFNHIHMRALARISFPEAEHNWTIRPGGIAGEVDIWNSAWRIRGMKSVTLHVSLNLHSNTSLSNIDQGLAEIWLECKFSVPQNKSIYWTVHIFL